MSFGDVWEEGNEGFKATGYLDPLWLLSSYMGVNVPTYPWCQLAGSGDGR
jgi:hypothetical protein